MNLNGLAWAQMYGSPRDIQRAEAARRLEIVRAKLLEDDARGPGFYGLVVKTQRRGRYPAPGNSETIMRNRVLRARSFGLTHDGLYD